ncbi:hypothetical protein CSA80_02380 [Candidatus Saccharibacteria bacterium]|nr:MAG: hypothetical protein CSA80_02380 [Candidatus Saccharibacteria bacterium]
MTTHESYEGWQKRPSVLPATDIRLFPNPGAAGAYNKAFEDFGAAWPGTLEEWRNRKPVGVIGRGIRPGGGRGTPEATPEAGLEAGVPPVVPPEGRIPRLGRVCLDSSQPVQGGGHNQPK